MFFNSFWYIDMRCRSGQNGDETEKPVEFCKYRQVLAAILIEFCKNCRVLAAILIEFCENRRVHFYLGSKLYILCGITSLLTLQCYFQSQW